MHLTRRSSFGLLAVIVVAWLVHALAMPRAASAQSADPAVQYMQRVARDLLAATRSRSPALIAATVNRYGATSAIALAALGEHRPKLSPADQPGYIAGTVGFISRYAAAEAPKYPVARVEFLPESRRAQYGLMVDTRIHLADGSTYDVGWMLIKAGTTYRVRDAQVLSFWLTPFLERLFTNYIAENGGNPRALIVALNRYQPTP